MKAVGEESLFSGYPQQVRASTARSDLRYVRLPGHFAVHGRVPASWESSVIVLLEEGRIAVCRGEPMPQPASSELVALSPVYAIGPEGPPAVPTGFIFVRFKETIHAAKRRAALAQAGYTVRQILPYAPHAAWVEASSGGIARALTRIASLEALPDVVSVEPQMLSESSRR